MPLSIENLEPRVVLSHSPMDHIHATLQIELTGDAVEIPPQIGLSESGHFNPHTHDEVGTLHIGEGGPAGLGDSVRYVTLEDFFDVWREQGGLAGSNPDSYLDNNRLMDYALDSQSQIQMLVNGRPNSEFEQYIPHDGDEIAIQFNRTSWHNAIAPTDVDGNGSTQVADAEIVIRELTDRRFTNASTGRVDSTDPKKFLDVDDDDIVSPFDALLVINRMNRPASPLNAQASRGIASFAVPELEETENAENSTMNDLGLLGFLAENS